MIIIVLLALIASDNICLGQRLNTLIYTNQSIDRAAPKYQAVADRYWSGPGGVLDFFYLVNGIRAQSAVNISNLFSNLTDVSTILSEFSTPCPYVDDALYHNNNQTAAQEFICCHLSVLVYPGMTGFMARLEQYFWGYPSGDYVNMIVTEQLWNVRELRQTEEQEIQVRRCKDDLRIHSPETETLRAEQIGHILGAIYRVYMTLLARAYSLQGCLSASTTLTGCLTSAAPALYVDIAAPNSKFVEYDPFFMEMCGGDALSAFETVRSTPTAC